MMLLLNRSSAGFRSPICVVATVAGLALLLATTAGAGTLYSWQTEDGNVSFTDDAKNIPARYRDQARTRTAKRLGDYERFTSQHAEGTQRYARELAARIEYLREVNADPIGSPRAEPADTAASIRVNGMDLRLPGTTDGDPVIVERVRVRSYGQIASRHDTVVRQGDRTLAIVRGRQSGEIEGGVGALDEKGLEFYDR